MNFDLVCETIPANSILNAHIGMMGTMVLVPGTDYLLQTIELPEPTGSSMVTKTIRTGQLLSVLNGETPVAGLRLYDKHPNSRSVLVFDLCELRPYRWLDYNSVYYTAKFLMRFVPIKIARLSPPDFRSFYKYFYLKIGVTIIFGAPMKIAFDEVGEIVEILQHYGAFLWAISDIINQIKILSDVSKLNCCRGQTIIPNMVAPPAITRKFPAVIDSGSPSSFLNRIIYGARIA